MKPIDQLAKSETTTSNDTNIHQHIAKYASYVAELASRGPDDYLFSGSHYKGLSHLLSSWQTNEDIQSKSLEPAFSLAVLRRIGSGLPSVEVFDATSGLGKLGRSTSHDGSPQIIFLRGYLSPNWIACLGSLYRIDAEFFRQKLDFLEDRDSFDLPSCPSNSAGILHLRVPTIFKRQNTLSRLEVTKIRQGEAKKIRKYLRSIRQNGTSMVRGFSIQDEVTYTIEQDISIILEENGGRQWRAIAWLDVGRDIPHDQGMPWQSLVHAASDSRSTPIPKIRHVSARILASIEDSKLTKSNDSRNPSLQSAYHLPEQFGLTLEQRAAACDPLYALSEVFFFFTSSESQFLNLMARRLRDIMDHYHRQEIIALDDLSYNERILADHTLRIEDLRKFLEHDLYNSWSSSESRSEEAAKAQAALTTDLAHLERQASALLRETKTAMSTISNGVILKESRKTIQRADQMHRLTLLAFLFLPLTFTTSFFGCNFKQFGTGILDIWVFFVTLVPVTLAALILCYWERISHFKWHTCCTPEKRKPEKSLI